MQEAYPFTAGPKATPRIRGLHCAGTRFPAQANRWSRCADTRTEPLTLLTRVGTRCASSGRAGCPRIGRHWLTSESPWSENAVRVLAGTGGKRPRAGGYYLLICARAVFRLIFSVGGVVNLAHGAFYALGATHRSKSPNPRLRPAVVLSPIAVAMLAFLFERYILRRFSPPIRS